MINRGIKTLIKNHGFTLMEVMITMFIMATLTVLISSSIRTAVKNKSSLEAHIAAETMLYDTLRVIKMDIERAFNYHDVFFDVEQIAIMQIEKEKKKGKGENTQQRQRPQKLTHFLGEKNSIHFTTLNHFRTKYNAQESNQMEVGYFVESCAGRDGKGGSNCLWRRSSPQIDDEVDKGGSKIVIAENVDKFDLSYRGNKETDDWVDQWRSDRKGRPAHQGRFPHLVKVEFKIENKKNKKVKTAAQSIVVRVEFPNNDATFKSSSSSPNTNSNPAGASQ